MKIKKLIRYLFFSEFISDLLIKIRSIKTHKIIFRGLYNNWSEVEDQNPWIGEEWLQKSKEKLDFSKKINKSKLTVPPNSAKLTCYSIPSIFINQISIDKNCSILDYCDGTGDVFFKIKKNIKNLGNIDYHVVDNSKLLSLGKKYKGPDDPIFFNKRIPENTSFDIVLISTSLQYIENYEEFLQPLFELKPKYFLFTRLWAGDYPTYLITSEDVQ